MGFQSMATDFNNYHKNALNVALHLVTTPAGYLGALALIKQQAGSQVLPRGASAACSKILKITLCEYLLYRIMDSFNVALNFATRATIS